MGGSSPPAEPKSSIDGQEHLMGCFSSLIHAKLQKQALLCSISGLETAPDAAIISCAHTACARSNPHHHQKSPISPKFPHNHLVAAARLQYCFCTSGGWKSNAKRALFFGCFFFLVVPGHITGRCVCSAKPPVSCFTNGTSLQVLASAVR